MKRLLLIVAAAVGLSGCIVHPLGLRPPPRPGAHPHHHHHGQARGKAVVVVGVR